MNELQEVDWCYVISFAHLGNTECRWTAKEYSIHKFRRTNLLFLMNLNAKKQCTNTFIEIIAFEVIVSYKSCCLIIDNNLQIAF